MHIYYLKPIWRKVWYVCLSDCIFVIYILFRKKNTICYSKMVWKLHATCAYCICRINGYFISALIKNNPRSCSFFLFFFFKSTHPIGKVLQYIFFFLLFNINRPTQPTLLEKVLWQSSFFFNFFHIKFLPQEIAEYWANTSCSWGLWNW